MALLYGAVICASGVALLGVTQFLAPGLLSHDGHSTGGWDCRASSRPGPRPAVGYSQSWVSNVLRRQQALTVDQAREISRRIDVPVHLLRFGEPGGDDPTKRRDFGKAMALALVPLPTRAVVDETTAPTLTAITGAQRRLDATTSARELARGVTAHVEMASRMLGRAGNRIVWYSLVRELLPVGDVGGPAAPHRNPPATSAPGFRFPWSLATLESVESALSTHTPCLSSKPDAGFGRLQVVFPV